MAITTFEEPIVTNGFLRGVISRVPDRCVGLALMEAPGGLPTVVGADRGQRESSPRSQRLAAWRAKASNLLAIALIYGLRATLVQGIRMTLFRVRMLAHAWLRLPSPSIAAIAARHGIAVRRFPHVNHPETRAWLASLDVDVIINQAPGILRDEFLRIPRLGVLNRHNGLLPRNRGLFSTFWAVYRREPASGVSVHFVVRALDAGPILIQREIPLKASDTVQSVARRCYALAPELMVEALKQLENGTVNFRENADELATYNSYPTLAQAWDYRRHRIMRLICGARVSPAGSPHDTPPQPQR